MSRKFSLLRVAILALAVGAGAGIGPAHANDADDDETFEQKIIRQFMRGLGLKDGRENGITYQERAPLVVPPSRDLPPPDTVNAAAREPAWPVDPDRAAREKARKERTAATARNRSDADTNRPLTPEELAKGRKADQGPVTAGRSDYDVNRPLTQKELGVPNDGNVFSSLWSKIGPAKDEVVPFTGEPARESLTAPPTGYRTPAPTRPYGVIVSGDPNKGVLDALKDPSTNRR